MLMGAVITVSSRVAVDDLERRARACLARDGAVQFAATTASRRQRGSLLALHARLTGPGGLDGVMVSLADRGDGTTCLAMFRADVSYPSWRGEPRTGPSSS
jgi:hypothetical protein